MKIVLAIPTGNRVDKIRKVVEKWRKACGFDIAIYTWDDETIKAVKDKVDYLFEGELQSFAKNQNLMARKIKDWDVFICGADDLYPESGLWHIETVCEQNPDKVIWVKDGLFDQQPTHPVITKGWYDKHGYIFDEQFCHNYCDTDLFVRTVRDGELVKCFQISFDHRHYLKTGKKPDEIYKLGASSFADDKKRFRSKYPLPVIKSDIKEIYV